MRLTNDQILENITGAGVPPPTNLARNWCWTCCTRPPRKFFALNDAGRAELARFWAKWEYVSSRIDKLKEGGHEVLGVHHR